MIHIISRIPIFSLWEVITLLIQTSYYFHWNIPETHADYNICSSVVLCLIYYSPVWSSESSVRVHACTDASSQVMPCVVTKNIIFKLNIIRLLEPPFSAVSFPWRGLFLFFKIIFCEELDETHFNCSRIWKISLKFWWSKTRGWIIFHRNTCVFFLFSFYLHEISHYPAAREFCSY